MITFNIECNRRLYRPLVSTNCTHVHSIITDCRILDMKSSFDDRISSCGERSFFFGPSHCRVNVFLRWTLEYGGLIQRNGLNGRCHHNAWGRNNIPWLPPEWLQRSQSRWGGFPGITLFALYSLGSGKAGVSGRPLRPPWSDFSRGSLYTNLTFASADLSRCSVDGLCNLLLNLWR